MKKLNSILASLLIITIIALSSLNVKADNTESDLTLTLGANLSEEQKQLIFNYLGITEDSVKIIIVNNDDERRYLEGIVDDATIGKRTFSCSLIQPTESGGIHVKTVNLTYVTCDMLRNALITSGINNCNIIAVSPIKVSGTGALTGIFMAYEQINGEELDEEKKELASEELVTTIELSEDIGQDTATTLLGDLKELVINSGLTDQEAITSAISGYLAEHNIEITEEQKWKLVEFLLKLSKQDYDIEEIKTAYENIQQTVSDIKEAAEKTKNIFQKIWQFLKDTWAKITGTYEEIKKTEEYQMITEQLGILTQTNDDLLGDSTIVTITEDEDILNEINNITEEYNDIDNQENDNVTFEDFSMNNEINESTFEDFSMNNENNQDVGINDEQIFADLSNIDESKDNILEVGMLRYVIYELQSLTAGDTFDYESNNIGKESNKPNESSPSFDDLTK